MSEYDGKVSILITADNRDAKQAVRETTQSIHEAEKQWVDSGDKMAGIFKKIATAAVAAKIGHALANLAKESVAAASALAEVQNVVDVTFGESANVINRWAQNAIHQFGLTETQAKQFASTMGAMLKSSGMAGDEIVDMSTKLAGLAADMASFYNMDFETAFAKIRSGISGETEPLKQLGINMSVANLEAFALTQGITKSFNAMSQGEQIMLRYQYLMQATSDAQGDFARTSDGFANATRLLSSNFDTLKTKIGAGLLPVVESVVNALNGIFDATIGAQRRTILDDIEEINSQTETKLAGIEKTYQYAVGIVSEMDLMAEKNPNLTTLGTIADNANKLKSGSPENWKTFLGAFSQLSGVTFPDPTNAVALADGLSGSSLTMTKAQAWQIMLGTMYDNIDTVAALTGKSAEGAREWLGGIAASASLLNPDDVQAWDTLFAWMVSGMTGLGESEEGQQLLDQAQAVLGGVSDAATNAAEGTLSMADAAGDATSSEEAWIARCRELVRIIPGLSDIIDVNTGEIRGGTEAVREYIEAWRELATKDVIKDAYQEQFDAITEDQGKIKVKRANSAAPKQKLAGALIASGWLEDDAWAFVNQLEEGGIYNANVGPTRAKDLNSMVGYHFTIDENTGHLSKSQVEFEHGEVTYIRDMTEEEVGLMNEIVRNGLEIGQMERDNADALDDWTERVEAAGYTVDQFDGTLERAAEEQALSTEMMRENLHVWEEATQAVIDYYNSVRDGVESSVSSVVSGFKKVETETDKELTSIEKKRNRLRQKEKLTAEQQNELREADLDYNRISGEGLITAQDMRNNMASQQRFMTQYMEYMRKAREIGIDEGILAELADGSTESFEYLRALSQMQPGEAVTEFNQMWRDTQSQKGDFVGELTDAKLAVDQTWQDLVTIQSQALSSLDQATEAYNSADRTISGYIEALKAKYPELKTEFDRIFALQNQMFGLGSGFSTINPPVGGGFFNTYNGIRRSGNGTHSIGTGIHSVKGYAEGLDYVPYDNFLARLHAGEAVLTAEEAKLWRSINPNQSGLDYGRLSGEIWDKAPNMGGSVYLDGSIVGRVMSTRQGDMYRQMERSGWRA